MANPSVTYTFVNGIASDATQVNQNFTDLINSLTDGTKTLTISSLIVTSIGAFATTGQITAGAKIDVNFANPSVDAIRIYASTNTNAACMTYLNMSNGSTRSFLGRDNSIGTNIQNGSAIPYAFCLWNESAIPILLGTNNTLRMTVDGTTGLITFANGINLGSTTLSTYTEGTFTATITGCTTSPTATFKYVQTGKSVILLCTANNAISNSTSLSFTGLPAAISPASLVSGQIVVEDNSNGVQGTWSITASATTLAIFNNASFTNGSFTNSGTKGLFQPVIISYILS